MQMGTAADAVLFYCTEAHFLYVEEESNPLFNLPSQFVVYGLTIYLTKELLLLPITFAMTLHYELMPSKVPLKKKKKGPKKKKIEATLR